MSEENLPEKPNPLEAFIDAPGVVIERIIVTFVLASAMTAPLFLVVILFGKINFSLFAFICAYSFIWLSSFIFIMYFVRASGGDATSFFNNITGIKAVAMLIATIPAIPLYFSVYPALTLSKKTTESTFLGKTEFDIILFFFQSFIVFSLTAYCISNIPDLSAQYFSGDAISISEAMLFGFDLVMKGVLFDIFEHFGISFSAIHQSSDLAGLFFSFLLRVTSSALVISIVVELFHSTRKRLVGND